jgi:hypothetical protein
MIWLLENLGRKLKGKWGIIYWVKESNNIASLPRSKKSKRGWLQIADNRRKILIKNTQDKSAYNIHEPLTFDKGRFAYLLYILKTQI